MQENDPDKKTQQSSKSVVNWIVLFGCLSFAAPFLVVEIYNIYQEKGALLCDVAQKHFPGSIGLCFAGMTAFFVVYIFEVKAGPIKFEGFGLKFEGAGGPIIFWVIVFLAVTTAIRLLWTVGP